MKKPKFKPELIIGGDRVAQVFKYPGLRRGIFIGNNRITPAQALRMAEWLKDAAGVVTKGRKR